MRLLCLVALLLTITMVGCHSPLHTPGVCGFADTLWDNYCAGDPCGCCGGFGLGCDRGMGCQVSCGCQGCGAKGACHGLCGANCQSGCGTGQCGNQCSSGCGSGSCSGGCNQGCSSGCGQTCSNGGGMITGACPNCGVSGGLCAGGCRACGMGFGGGMLGGRGGCGAHGPIRTAAALTHRPFQNVAHSIHQHAANGVCCGGAVGPEYGAVTYPYYTTRGPRDFFVKNPSSIGP